MVSDGLGRSVALPGAQLPVDLDVFVVAHEAELEVRHPLEDPLEPTDVDSAGEWIDRGRVNILERHVIVASESERTANRSVFQGL